MSDHKFVLLNKEIINQFIENLHRPNIHMYGGQLLPKDMNVVWGVMEKSTGIIITEAYVPEIWSGKEGDHTEIFDAFNNGVCISVPFETNAYGDYWEVASFGKAIRYYMHDGFVNGDFDIFKEEFERTHNESIYDYEKRIYQEYYNAICSQNTI